MITIGWCLLIVILITGSRLRGVSIGLLSGLGLAFLTFSRLVRPVAPPNDLIILQAAWMIFMATLEAVHFFYGLGKVLKALVASSSKLAPFFSLILSYGLAFCTGDKKWIYAIVPTLVKLGKVRNKSPMQLFIPMHIGAHMALLASPLSMSGMLLLVVAGQHGWSPAMLIGRIVAITLTITCISSLLLHAVPYTCFTKLDIWLESHYEANNLTDVLPKSKARHPMVYLFLGLLLGLTASIFFYPTSNLLTCWIASEVMASVRIPIFFTLILLAVAAIVMLSLRVKPVDIIKSHRFKLNIQHFFIFLGLTWLLETLINHDKAYLLEKLNGFSIYKYREYGYYLIVCFYMLTIEVPILIWLVVPLLAGVHVSMNHLIVCFVALQCCSGLVTCWLSKRKTIKRRD
ncbi:MAG: hypothetical protein K2X94_04385 [Amoebophilaceae bacterium]|nr:hypothetical protein [Amoebophilaceae bacterium]